MNLWHDIDPGTPDEINTIIEINRGSHNKYEIDKKIGIIALDRVSHTAQVFPFDYGFVPQTLWEDGDPLDIVLLSTYSLLPGILVKVRPVAILRMIDNGEGDDKIIAVPVDDPRFNETKNLEDINRHTLKEIEHFYSTYKLLQKKVVEVKGFGNRDEAIAAFLKSQKLYQEKFAQ